MLAMLLLLLLLLLVLLVIVLICKRYSIVNKYLVRSYYVPGTVLGGGYAIVDKINRIHSK